MQQVIKEEKRCATCNHITNHKQYDSFCDHCKKIINHKIKYYTLDILTYHNIRVEAPIFCDLSCMFNWLISSEYKIWRKANKELLKGAKYSIEFMPVQDLEFLIKQIKIAAEIEA